MPAGILYSDTVEIKDESLVSARDLTVVVSLEDCANEAKFRNESVKRVLSKSNSATSAVSEIALPRLSFKLKFYVMKLRFAFKQVEDVALYQEEI